MLIRVLFLMMLGVIFPATPAWADELLLELRPEPGVVVHVVRQPDWSILLRQPFGDNIRMPRPGKRQGLGQPPPDLQLIDIDFDGHDDLAIHFPEAKPDDPLQIVRYLPAERRYETLYTSQKPRMLCRWRDAVPDPENQTQILSCQRDALKVTETVRFNAFAAPWLENRHIEYPLTDAHQYPYIPIANQFSRWNETGQEQEVFARDDQGAPVYITIPVTRTSLFDEPGRETDPIEYLHRGDRVQLLDRMVNWLRVVPGSDDGQPARWIWIPDAFDLVDLAASDESSDQRELVFAMGDFVSDESASDDPVSVDPTDSLVDIFPIALTNTGSEPWAVERPELHLIFYDREGWHFWTQSLGSGESLTISPGERVAVEPGTLYDEYGFYTLVRPTHDEFEHQVRILPFELYPSKYSVRVALTSPELDTPVFSGEKHFLHNPSGPLIKPRRPDDHPDDRTK